MARTSLQLSFAFVDDRAPATSRVVTTRALRHHPRCNTVLQKLHYTLRFFPELQGRQIRVGLTRAASGMAIAGGNEVWFNPSHLSYHTIAHELVHLLQGQQGIPTGERSCDVFALARHWTLNDTPPYYVRVPIQLVGRDGKLRPEGARLIYDTARRALELRNSGTRRYISFFEKSLAELNKQPRTSEILLKGLGLDVDQLFLAPK